ncbi:signal protein PDZ [Clostridium sp.]|uniref:signal protein PDZ n=1 Tax=Clostridium sp. TaxID=1506 RepID=UPI00284BBAC5|nr:signal protein PDZ [Clostridium sp.]MDR3593334.1 signal protein PDZ [Clostridium sp.]
MSLFIYTLRSVASAIVTPPLVFLLISLIIILHLKNKKLVAMQKIILGGSVNSSIELTLSQLVLGIIGGCIGSLILTSLGVMFNDNSGIWYLFIISILLTFIKPRLICFSYSGAILGFISIMLKSASIFVPGLSDIFDLNINIFYLVILIGVFHIIEGIVVMIDGDRGAVPVFTNKDGKILGGYALKRYWILPIAIMIAVTMDNSTLNYVTESIQNPNWWPLIKSPSGFALLASSVISISPFYTILGYSAVTFTRNKREKALSSGIHIAIYGAILIGVSQIAKVGILGEMLVLAFMPFAHEFMLKLQLKNEERRTPKFVSDEEGLVILEISTDSKIKEFGIGIESKVLSINDKGVNSETEIYSILRENLYNAMLKIKDSHGIVKDINFRHNRNTRLGILLVPRNVNKEDIIPVEDNSFNSVFNTIKNSNHKEKNESNEKDNKRE